MSPKKSNVLHAISTTISQLQLPSGGFPYQVGNEARPDSTAWAVIGLSMVDTPEFVCEQGRAYLQQHQDTMGRVCISPSHPQASWPTPLAMLAWHSSPKYELYEKHASEFLLAFTGNHFPKSDPSIIGHDPTIIGWPWIADTHSWIIPTGMAILALQVAGLGAHSRVKEGQAMILDRQLPHGGWNYGNTSVFGKELHPLPECTGIALQALANDTDRQDVEESLDYLLKKLPTLHTPISLGWALLGLGTWGLRPSQSEELILKSLELQERYGPYPLPSLALLSCAANASAGLRSLFELSPVPHHLSLPQRESFV